MIMIHKIGTAHVQPKRSWILFVRMQNCFLFPIKQNERSTGEELCRKHNRNMTIYHSYILTGKACLGIRQGEELLPYFTGTGALCNIKLIFLQYWKTMMFWPFQFQRLRGLVILGRLSTIFCKGDNFCDFLFAFLHIESLLKRGLL